MRRPVIALLAFLLPVASAAAQSSSADSYSRYELLAPDTASFAIIYDVSATTGGARFYFNPIREGSEASDESVVDRMTGGTLKFEVVTGEQARADGQRGAAGGHYIKIYLARQVPEGGEARLRILKTYKDPKSYYTEGDLIVFDRSLGIKRNVVVLPKGYELVSCNFPSQVIEEADGRLAISHWNNTPSAAPLVIKARRLPASAATRPAAAAGGAGSRSRPSAANTQTAAPAAPATPAPADELHNLRISERAFQDREIVYFLKPPDTHAFSLYHDYTESREGVDKYINVVREGSKVSDPSALVLDTGETLQTRTLRGDEIAKADLDVRGVTPGTEVVVIDFQPVKAGQSVRLRISETYTDPSRYGLVDGQLVWHRSFGRPANDVVLPDGWYLTDSSIPAVVRLEPDGRTRLEFVNPRPDSIDVILKARRRR